MYKLRHPVPTFSCAHQQLTSSVIAEITSEILDCSRTMFVFLLMVAVMAVATGNVRADDEKATCTVDLIFLDDGSSSLCEGDLNSCPNWQSNIDFIKDIIKYLDVDNTKSRVAYLKYGNICDLRWNLDVYTTEQSLLDAISHEDIPRGELSDTDSFKVVIEKVFTAATLRQDVRRVAILITDHANITDAQAINASDILQEKSDLKMMMVCLNTTSSKCGVSCAAPLSSYPHQEGVTYFMPPTYSVIDDVREALEKHICVFSEEPATAPPA